MVLTCIGIITLICKVQGELGSYIESSPIYWLSLSIDGRKAKQYIHRSFIH